MDGWENFYSSAYDEENEETFHTVLDKTTSTWSRKTWYGLSETDVVDGSNVWTDGEDIYYLSGYSKNQYVLDKATSTWNIIGNYEFARSTGGFGSVIWTDGDNTYYSYYGEDINYVFGPKYLEVKTSSITTNVPLVDLGPNITISDIAPQEDDGDDGDIWLVYKY